MLLRKLFLTFFFLFSCIPKFYSYMILNDPMQVFFVCLLFVDADRQTSSEHKRHDDLSSLECSAQDVLKSSTFNHMGC